MKKLYTIFTACIAMLLTSCQEYSYIENELHGFWQVTQVENTLTGESSETKGDLYYSFQRSMVMLNYKSPTKPSGMMMTQYLTTFDLSTDSITMGDFRINMEYDKKVDLEALHKFGIYDEYTTFAWNIEKNQTLILTSDKARITLRKY